MSTIVQQKSNRLFMFLGGFFIANALIAEFIGVKIFSLEQSFGFSSFNWQIFGGSYSMNLTAGVLLWPVVFIVSDLINEYFGPKGVRFLSNGAIMIIIYAFIMVFISTALIPADFWPKSKVDAGVTDMQSAYQAIFGQGMWIIVGSLVAFLVGQILDVFVFHKIKQMTGEKYLWLRATGSTVVSQLVDSFVVLYIAFGLGADWSMDMIIATGIVNYIYKFTVAVLLTPVLYWVHYAIDGYLGEELSKSLREEAIKD